MMRNYYDDPFNGYGDDEYYEDYSGYEDHAGYYAEDDEDYDDRDEFYRAETPLGSFLKLLRALWGKLHKNTPPDDISDIPF